MLGSVLGILGIYILGTFDIIDLPEEVYGTSKLPLELSSIDFIATIVGATIIVILASFYPSKKATKVDILTTLRNE
jgi:putative ABC transport system permease protein